MYITGMDTSSPRQHFEILDGLRGIAAVCVVIFHFMEITVPDYNKSFIGHGYLAVDFFFCLSGFVIAYAYDRRMKSMGVLQFFKQRLIRLHPLVLIGSVIGLLGFLFDPFSNLHTLYNPEKTFLMFAGSCLLVPYPVVQERFFNLFHLNPPTWSLFFEYIANIFYVLVLYKLRNRFLYFLLAIAAIALCLEASHAGNLSVGWDGNSSYGGLIRVFYSFIAGMLVYRTRLIIKSKLGFISMSILLVAGIMFPYADKFNFITDPVIVIFYFPLIVALGAGARLTPLYTAGCKFLGNISYPLYMTHYPFIWIYLSYVEKYKPAMKEMVVIIPVATVLLVCLAWCVMTFIDIPVRNYLTLKMKNKLVKDTGI